MTEQNENRVPKKKRVPNYTRIIPAALAVIILFVILIGVLQLWKWNKGEKYIIDPDEVPDVSTETEDFISFMDPFMTRGADDDGVLTVVVLGNSFIDYKEDNEQSIADLLISKMNATVYDCSFKDSNLTALYPDLNDPTVSHMDLFGFYWLSDSIQKHDFSLQRNALLFMDDDELISEYEERIATLESIDFASVDLILIMYDGHDYLAKHPFNNKTDMYDITTMEGSLVGSYLKYSVNYPYMHLMFVAPTFCYVIDEDGNKTGCDIANLGYDNLPTGLSVVLTNTASFNYSYLDNFYGIKINAETADKFLLEDGITPNERGRELIAERISNVINGKLISPEDK